MRLTGKKLTNLEKLSSTRIAELRRLVLVRGPTKSTYNFSNGLAEASAPCYPARVLGVSLFGIDCIFWYVEKLRRAFAATTHCAGGWVGPEAAVNSTEKISLPEFELGTVQHIANEDYWFKFCFSYFCLDNVGNTRRDNVIRIHRQIIRILLKRILKVYGVKFDWIFLDQGSVRLFWRKQQIFFLIKDRNFWSSGLFSASVKNSSPMNLVVRLKVYDQKWVITFVPRNCH